MSQVLVTGSSGFVGRALTQALIKNNYQVLRADRSCGIDLTDPVQVNRLPDVDLVIHLAALNDPRSFVEKPYSVIRTGVLSTQYLLDRYAGCCQRFVLASTSQCYAATADRSQPTTESVALTIDNVTHSRNSYAASKILNEMQVISACKELAQSYTIIRYHHLFGPGQKNQFIVDFIRRVLDGDVSVKNGNHTRTYLYIDDAIRATMDIIKNLNCQNEIINVGGEQEISLAELAQLILNQMGVTTALQIENSTPNRLFGDIGKLKSLLNFRAQYSLEQGIQEILTKDFESMYNTKHNQGT